MKWTFYTFSIQNPYLLPFSSILIEDQFKFKIKVFQKSSRKGDLAIGIDFNHQIFRLLELLKYTNEDQNFDFKLLDDSTVNFVSIIRPGLIDYKSSVVPLIQYLLQRYLQKPILIFQTISSHIRHICLSESVPSLPPYDTSEFRHIKSFRSQNMINKGIGRHKNVGEHPSKYIGLEISSQILDVIEKGRQKLRVQQHSTPASTAPDRSCCTFSFITYVSWLSFFISSLSKDYCRLVGTGGAQGHVAIQYLEQEVFMPTQYFCSTQVLT